MTNTVDANISKINPSQVRNSSPDKLDQPVKQVFPCTAVIIIIIVIITPTPTPTTTPSTIPVIIVPSKVIVLLSVVISGVHVPLKVGTGSYIGI